MLCVAEEMEQQLQELTQSRNEPDRGACHCGRGRAARKAAVERRARDCWSWKTATAQEHQSRAEDTRDGSDAIRDRRKIKQLRNWLETLVVARSAQGSAHQGAGSGRVLLERRGAGGARQFATSARRGCTW